MVIKTGVFAGIIALILAFIAEIPIYLPNDLVLSFKIFSFDNTDFYFWEEVEFLCGGQDYCRGAGQVWTTLF